MVPAVGFDAAGRRGELEQSERSTPGREEEVASGIEIERVGAGARAVALVEEVAPGTAEAVGLEPELDGEVVALIDRRALRHLHGVQAIEEEAAAELPLLPTRIEPARDPGRDGRGVVGNGLDVEAVGTGRGDVTAPFHGEEVRARRREGRDVDVGGGEGVEDLVAVGREQPPVGVAGEREIVEEEALAGAHVEAIEVRLAPRIQLSADGGAGRDRYGRRRVNQAEGVGDDVIARGVKGERVVARHEIEQRIVVRRVARSEIAAGDESASGAGERPKHLRVREAVEVQARALREREGVAIDLARVRDRAVDARADLDRGRVVGDRLHVEAIAVPRRVVPPSLDEQRVGAGE